MIIEFNRFLIYLGSKLEKAERKAKEPNEDLDYNNGYLQALLDVRERAVQIYHGED